MQNRTKSSAGTRAGAVSFRWVALWTIGLAPVVLAAVMLWYWIDSWVPEWVYWQAALVVLSAARWVYVISVASALAGALGMGTCWFRARRAPRSRPWLARGLTLCASLLFAAVAAEAASAIRLRGMNRESAVPVGGLDGGPAAVPESRLVAPVADITLRTEFPDPPHDRDIDLVVLGESSAEGVPFSEWLSLGALLQWKMSEAMPGRAIRARIIARSGDTLEWQHRELANLPRRPDLLVVYCGHNEFTSRLGTSRDLDFYLDARAPSRWDRLQDAVARASPLCALVERTVAKCRIAIPPALHGGRRLVDAPIYAEREYSTLLADFRRRLEAIVCYADQVGALTVLIAPAGNDADFEPNRSFLPAATSGAERAAFEREFLAARRLEAVDRAAAIARFRHLLALQPGFAETHFRLAELLEEKGDSDEAYQHFVAARDHDGFPVRCLSAFQEVYRGTAARHDCILIDMQAYFHAIGRGGLLDDELFQDAMHPSLRGQIALAQAVLHALQARGAFGWPSDTAAPVIEPAQCAYRFRLGQEVWRRICLWGIMFNNLTAPLRYDPARRQTLARIYAEAADLIGAGGAPTSAGLPNIGVPAAVPIRAVPSRAHFRKSISW
jgi:lysophospholipase L1-like esterase